MARDLKEYLPPLKEDGLTTDVDIDFSGSSSVKLPSTGVTGNIIEVSLTGQTTEAATDRVFFVANRAYQVVAVREVHATAAGGTSTLQVTKDSGTDAPGAGDDLLDSAFDLNGTANTVQEGTLVSTEATLQLAAGDRLAVDFANTIQSTAGLAVTVSLRAI